MLKAEEHEHKNSKFLVNEVHYIPAQVKVVKCMVQNVAVDISFNQMEGLCTLCFIEQVDRLIGKDHLFKRSIILIKAWCYYESRILGAQHGLISTYALEILVLYIINHFHSSLHGPLTVLYRFLNYYSTFDWDKYCISFTGAVVISSLPEIVVKTPENGGSDLLLAEKFWMNSGEVLLVPTRTPETRLQAFPVKHLNIMDPLKDDNNLGRSVNKGNFHRIRNAFCLGARKLGETLMLPEEHLSKGIKKFFSCTLDMIRSGQRSDVQFPVPVFGVGSSEIFDLRGDYDNFFGCVQYIQQFHSYTLPIPVQLIPPASLSQVQNNSVQTQLERNFFPTRITNDSVPSSSFHPNTPPKSIVSLSSEKMVKFRGTGAHISAVKFEEKLESRETDTYIHEMGVEEKLKVRGMGKFIPGMGVEEKVMLQRTGTYFSDTGDEVKLKSRGTGTFIPVVGVDEKSKSQGTFAYIQDTGAEENLKINTYHPGMGVEEKAKSRGTGTYSPDSKRNSYRQNIWGRGRNVEPTTQGLLPKPMNTEQIEVSSETDKDGSSRCFDLSLEEFPLLPVIKKAIPSANSKFGQPTKSPQAKESLPQLGSIEFGKLGLFSTVDTTPCALTITTQGPPESSESNEEMVVMQRYKLEDDEDFPPLSAGLH
ncbi:uncharacterized protein LOC132312466 isoform X2 [Cornus florida]|nr:uncharacterized protein LOC132312466 isoform X2 [Cornus florida]